MVKAHFRTTQSSKRSTSDFRSFRLRPSQLVVLLTVLLAGFYTRLFVRLSISSRELLEPFSTPLAAAYPWDGWQVPTGNDDVITIGYFVSVTACGDSSPLADAAAVLKHSIHLASIHGNLGGRYDYKMHAIYHPDAAACILPLATLGYELVLRDTPVKVEEIQGDWMRERIRENGCCGEKEIIKLEAYTFTEFPVVVHLDLDVIILKPLDDLFDAMLDVDALSKVARMWPDGPIPEQINAFFTRDYGVVNWNIQYKPVQGGLLILRPDREVYDQLIAIFREGDFRKGTGWGGKVGPFYGGMTVQGLLPYFYDVLQPGQSVSLNNCVYNNMANNPTDEPTDKEILRGKCRSGKPILECEDCRRTPIEDIVSTHFTNCAKPWFCIPYAHDLIDHRQCRKMGHEWYRIRSDLEKSWGRSGMGPGNWKQTEHFFGYCIKSEKDGYLPIQKPYGKATTTQ